MEENDAVSTQGRKRDGYVFISYKSQSETEAAEIQHFLEENGYRCWRAPESLNKRGSLDYSKDIFEAIRNCACVLFVISDSALGSDWVLREIRFAMDKCRKPVIPYVVEAISEAKTAYNDLYTTLELRHQILNQDLSHNKNVLLPYLQQVFNAESVQEEVVKSSVKLTVCTREELCLNLELADYYLQIVDSLTGPNELLGSASAIMPGIREYQLRESATKAALHLIKMLKADVSALEDGSELVQAAKRKLMKLSYEQGRYFGEDVFDEVKAFAAACVPWANFVSVSKMFFREGGGETQEAPTFRALTHAVKDSSNPYAFVLYGNCYEFGIGCTLSGMSARFWYEKATRDGFVEGYSFLGNLFSRGAVGVLKDDELALRMFKEGIEKGDLGSYRWLGVFYAWRTGLHPEYAEFADQVFREGMRKDGAPSLMFYAYNAFTNKDIPCREFSRDALFRMLHDVVAPAALGMCAVRESTQGNSADISYEAAGIAKKDCFSAMWFAQGLLASVRDRLDKEMKISRARKIPQEFFKMLLAGVKGDESGVAQYIRDAVMTFQSHPELIQDRPILDPQKDSETLFWRKMKQHGKTPLELKALNKYTPHKLLEALLYYQPRDPGSEFARIQEVWRVFRRMECIWWRMEVVSGDILEQISRDKGSSIVRSLTPRQEVGELLVALARLCPVLSAKFMSLKRELDRLPESALHGFMMKTFITIRSWKGPDAWTLRMAFVLADGHHELSHPGLAEMLEFYRRAYLWSGGTLVGDLASKMAQLFLVNNARFEDVNKNEGFLTTIKAALRKALYMKRIDAVPLLLEICLFGFKVGTSAIEPDFDMVVEIDAVIADLYPEILASGDPVRVDKLKNIAYVLSRIYIDEKMVNNAQCEEKWGRSRLHNRLRSTLWLERAYILWRSTASTDQNAEAGAYLGSLAEFVDEGFVFSEAVMSDVDAWKRGHAKSGKKEG